MTLNSLLKINHSNKGSNCEMILSNKGDNKAVENRNKHLHESDISKLCVPHSLPGFWQCKEITGFIQIAIVTSLITSTWSVL